MPDPNKADEYLELADRAKREAERATNADDRNAWLRAAAAWLRLLQMHQPQPPHRQPQPQPQQQPQQRLDSDDSDQS